MPKTHKIFFCAEIRVYARKARKGRNLILRILQNKSDKTDRKEGAMEVMGNEYTKLVVLDLITNKEIAVVTDREITTANPEIVVKLTPAYGGNK